MRLKNIVLSTLLLVAIACNGLEKSPSHLVQPDYKAKQEGANDEPQSLPEEDFTFFVSVEFVIYQSQMEKYPETSSAFHRALHEWNQNLPISSVIYYEDPTMTSVMHGPMFAGIPGVVEVLFCDLQDPVLGYSQGIIGLWDSANYRLLLDSSLEEYPEIAYSAALHELGHFFGLPHIVGTEDHALTGWIIVNNNAENYVMFPRNVKDKDQNVLSRLEKVLASNYVISHLTLPDIPRKNNDCCLTNDK